jgi:hypothetical protein
MKRSKLLAIASAAGAALAIIPPALAESNFVTGGGALSASAKVDFQITIPKILYLRVGTGSAYATGTLANVNTVDLIQFAVPAASVGNGTAITGTGGDLSGGVVTAALIGNNGTITLYATATGALSNGAESINFSEISTAAGTLTSATALAAPTLTNATSANVTITPAAKVVNRDARWTYTYLNTAPQAAGIYGGVNVNNGRVTYTASMP